MVRGGIKMILLTIFLEIILIGLTILFFYLAEESYEFDVWE